MATSTCELIPYGKQIICQYIQKDMSGYSGGIFIPDLKKDEMGTFLPVVAIGSQVPQGLLKLGDSVVLQDKNSTTLKYKGEMYIISDSDNILMVVEQ